MSRSCEVVRLPASVIRLAAGENETVTEADARAVLALVTRLQAERDEAHGLLIEHAVRAVQDRP